MMTRRTRATPSGWPAPRAPRWLLVAVAVLVAGLVAAAIPHRPSTAERAQDLRAMVKDLTTDIESCAGGVTDSLTALGQIRSGASHDVKTAVSIASTAAANCSPANSMPMDDLVQYQAPESLASFHLDAAVNDLVTWAFPLAQRVQLDVAALVTAGAGGAGGAAVAGGAAAGGAAAGGAARLRHDQQALDAERSRFDELITAASRSLSANVAPPALPG